MRATFLLLGLTAATVAAPVPKDFGKKLTDAEAFVGEWDTVVAETAGQPTGKATWTFDAELNMTSVSPGGRGPGSKWAIRLDPTKTPKEIDITDFKGIYEFDGADIKVAFASVRPTTFDPKPGVYYNLLRRVPAAKK